MIVHSCVPGLRIPLRFNWLLIIVQFLQGRHKAPRFIDKICFEFARLKSLFRNRSVKDRHVETAKPSES